VVVAAVALPFAIGWAWARYARARGLERRRMQWFGWAAATGATTAAVAGALRLLVSWPNDLALVIGVSTVLLPLSLMAATSARLVSFVDRLLGHTVAVGGLVGLVAAVYVVVVLGLGRVPTEEERTLLALSMAAAAVAALLFPATRARLNELAARVVYGEQHAPDEVLRTFGDRLTRALPMDELLLQAAESLRKTFGYDAIEIWTGQAGSLERTVSLPERGRARMTIGAKELPVLARTGVSGPAWLKVWLPNLLAGREQAMVRMAPVVHQAEVLGIIVVERDAGETFSEEEERVLTDLARTLGVALHNLQLDSALQQTLDEVRRQAEDLRQSRQRIVHSADEARRQLERDVHDGAQQNVVALAVKARLIKTLLDSDPATARGMLDELGGDIQEAVQQLRDLAHGIYPKLLVDRGLEPALQSIATKAALPTTVETDGIGRYPSDVEAAVYFCCLEALQNAGKHAGEGARATLSVREQEGALLFEIADDGAGFDVADKGLGHGFVNMKDRVGAAGGTVTVSSTPGAGTVVSGRIPLE
jgi:signal transduction histidine kinase